MRHRLLIVFGLAALLVAASVATTQGSHRRACSIKGADVIVQTKDARVLATKPRISGQLQVRKVYACSFSKGKLIPLGTD